MLCFLLFVGCNTDHTFTAVAGVEVCDCVCYQGECYVIYVYCQRCHGIAKFPCFFLLSYAVRSNFKNKSRAYWAKSYICGSTKVQWTYVIFCSGFEPITFWFKGNAILYMYIVRDVTELPKHQNVRYQATKLQNLKENNGSFYS